MNKDQKAAVVDEIAEQIEAADAVFAVDYRGISVPGAAELRGKLRDADATFRIVKNRLTLRAAEKAGAETLQPLLDGPTALTFVRGDAALAAKALHDFSRANDVLEFKGGLMGADEISVDEIKSIARLPGRDVLHGQLVGTIAAPLTGLVRGLSQLVSGLAVGLQQVHEQRLAAGEAEPAEADEAPEEPAEEAPAEEPAEEAPAEQQAEEPPAEQTEEAPAQDAAGEETANEEADASA